MTQTIERIEKPSTTGLVLHKAAGYDLLLWLVTLGRERAFRERMLKYAHLQPGETVLDVGCGTGTLALLAKEQVGPTGEVCGIDASPQMIARAQKKARRAGIDVSFKNAFAQSLPYPHHGHASPFAEKGPSRAGGRDPQGIKAWRPGPRHRLR